MTSNTNSDWNGTRIIGIRHRVKKTVAGEARPTQLVVIKNGKQNVFDLETEQDELDWLLGKYPVEWRKALPSDDIASLPAHHIKWHKMKPSATTALTAELSIEALPDNWKKYEGKAVFIVDKIPSRYDGMRYGDTVVIGMGGSGDRFASALSNCFSEAADNTGVYRLPSFLIKEKCGSDKDKQAACLAQLYIDHPEFFRRMTVKDRALILVREQLRARTEAMKARIVVEQQLRISFIGQIFCSPEGKYPEGSIEILFDNVRANDEVLLALAVVEKKREKELVNTLKGLKVFQDLFDPIEGCGPMIAARLIASIGDIQQFSSDAKLKAYVGAHVLPDGRFARKRSGEVANWSNDARQALFLLGDQFNRRPNSVWGIKLRQYKTKFRAIHPEVVIGENGKKKYTDMHIHKMATWRILTKFVEWLYKEWRCIDREAEKSQ